VHVVPASSPEVTAMRGFRDALRADPRLRRRYAALKQGIVAGGPVDPMVFSNAKHDWIVATLGQLGLASPDTSGSTATIRPCSASGQLEQNTSAPAYTRAVHQVAERLPHSRAWHARSGRRLLDALRRLQPSVRLIPEESGSLSAGVLALDRHGFMRQWSGSIIGAVG
jgi:hypothetical protein